MAAVRATPPLNEGEELFWRSFMRLVITVPRALGDELERSAGLTATEYTVLMHLSEAPQRQLRMSDLAERTALSASRMTRVVDHMAQRSLVTKHPCPDDGRSMLAMLTRDGLQTLKKAYPVHLRGVRRNILDHLSPEETTVLAAVLTRLAAAVDSANPPPPRRATKPAGL
jgi:DNA-binding MarR family transcriptional regulator